MSSYTYINDFELLETIGSGSYSIVHRARNKISKECVAIKCIEKRRLSNSSRENLFTEIKLLKTLKHKYIVEMYDFRYDEKKIYIIMELCDAGNLSTYIRKHHRLPETTCKFFMRQLALALQYMRDKNVSHFDLKPQNLLLTKSPQLTLKVADFGFAQHLSHDEENTVIKGSPLYMAPEILLKNCYDSTADLWSIGVILYECLFGKAPYSSKSIDELLVKIQNQEKIEINKLVKVSDNCKDILMKLLIHNPKNRINFDSFFLHPFLNLNNEPTDVDNFVKATDLVTKAVNEDLSENYKDAYHLYCKGLQYFVPLIRNELDDEKREQFQTKANEYLSRAEELKNYVFTVYDEASSSSSQLQPPLKSDDELVDNKNNDKIISFKNKISDILKPSNSYQLLNDMCSSSPDIQNALDIGRQGELYAYENNLKTALDNLTIALGILVPHLNTEPNGCRKDLLQKQTVKWMNEAESIKSLISAKDLGNEIQTKKLITNCCLQ